MINLSKGDRAPARIAVFGASGHIGGPLARFVRYAAPEVGLRLIGRNAAQLDSLRAGFGAHVEVAIADYLDRAALQDAVREVDAAFIVTPHFLDEARAMENLVAVLRTCADLKLIVRITGFQPDTRVENLPAYFRDFGTGVAIQHFIARDVLDASGLPVTYLNMGASLMDNFLRNSSLKTDRTLTWPVRRVPYLDPREVGEAAARIFLAADPSDLGRVHTLNNGHDLLSGVEVADLMSDVLQEPIAHDGSREGYLAANQQRAAQRFGRADAAEYLWAYFEYERHVEAGWSLNGKLEQLLGRRPRTLRAWLEEYRTALFEESV
jgi:uncharacterized protein YbjT (DUF2867 family)